MCFVILLIPSVHEDMDSLLEKPQEIRLNHPYLVHFRINDQESFCVHNLTLSEYSRLIHDDEYTVNYIRGLITSNVIKNTDENINVISRSKDDVNFESIDVSLYLAENQISEGIILLEELEALPDMSISYVNGLYSPSLYFPMPRLQWAVVVGHSSSRSEMKQIHLLQLLLRSIATGYDPLLLPLDEAQDSCKKILKESINNTYIFCTIADTPTSSTQEELDSGMEISVMSQSSMDTSPSTSTAQQQLLVYRQRNRTYVLI